MGEVGGETSRLKHRGQSLSHASSGRVIALCCGCSALGRREMVSRLSSSRRRSRPQLSACGLGLRARARARARVCGFG